MAEYAIRVCSSAASYSAERHVIEMWSRKMPGHVQQCRWTSAIDLLPGGILAARWPLDEPHPQTVSARSAMKGLPGFQVKPLVRAACPLTARGRNKFAETGLTGRRRTHGVRLL